jgi:hypothetical protein
MGIAVVALICLFGIAVCAKTIAVLGRYAPWTSSAWFLTALYFIAVLGKVMHERQLAGWVGYAPLVGLTIAFLVAGIRDEPQAEPWWWPKRRGQTRAQRSALITRDQKRPSKSKP